MQVVKIEALNDRFKEGQIVNPASLLKAGLIAKIKLPIKILNGGELTVEKLVFANVNFSASALENIKKHQGVIQAPKAVSKK